MCYDHLQSPVAQLLIGSRPGTTQQTGREIAVAVWNHHIPPANKIFSAVAQRNTTFIDLTRPISTIDKGMLEYYVSLLIFSASNIPLNIDLSSDKYSKSSKANIFFWITS